MTASCFKTALFITFMLISFSLACSKFEDGPVISFLPVKNRLAREWKVEYVTNLNTGIKHSAEYESWLLTINKEETFTNKIIYNQKETIYSGKWELISKNRLKFEYTSTSGTIIEFYTISRLTKKQLWIKDEIQQFHYYSEE